MTRKRQNVEQVEAPVVPEKKKSFPPKKQGGYANKQNYEAERFEKNYGYVADRNEQEEGYNNNYHESYEDNFGGANDSQKDETSFPTEITSYLKGILVVLETEKDLGVEFFDKCAKECAGSEVALLTYKDSSTVVESVFGSKPIAATLFLQVIANQKHKVIVDLMFGGCSARTIEKLLYSSAPITLSSIDTLTKFVDLLFDNWQDAITTQPSTYLLRSIGRVTCGLGPIENQPKFGVVKRVKPKFYNATVRTALQRIFAQLADRLFDAKTTGPHWDNLFCSVLLQSFFEADAAVHGNRADAFVENALANLEESDIINKLQGKESSRVWDSIFTFCTDRGIKLFWEKIASNHFKSLVYHPTANFPIQRLLAAEKSEETAVAICNVVIPLISTLLAEKKPGVVINLLKCCSSHASLEELALKELRKHFNAETASTKEHFLFNVLTLNPQNGSSMDLSKCQYHGSMILQELFKFTKVKTISACISAISDKTLVGMAFDKIASHIVQVIINSPTVAEDIKTKVLQSLEKSSPDLIKSPVGSHVFECMWDSPLFKVAQKQNLMKSFVPLRNESKNWKFAMLRCDMNLFRSDRKAWVKKQKEWKKPEKS